MITVLNFWYIIAVMFVCMEIFAGFPLIFFFIGLAALVVGGMLTTGVIAVENISLQVISFLLLSIIWLPIFWQRFKRAFQPASTESSQFFNVIGRKVEITKEFSVDTRRGEVKWSGTYVKAMLSEDSELPQVGAFAEVVDIQGNKLIIKITNKEE